MGHTIIRTKKKKHVKTTLIRADNYLRNEVLKTNQLQTAEKSEELLDHFTELHKLEQSRDTEIDRSCRKKQPQQ